MSVILNIRPVNMAHKHGQCAMSTHEHGLYFCINTLNAVIFSRPVNNKNSSGDETANVNFYAVCPEATRIR